MGRLIKYEIRGNYKFILGILAIVILASSFIQGVICKQMVDINQDGINNRSDIIHLMSFIAVLVIFGAFLVAFINIVGSFKKELYEDSGYLTFSLPLTGNQILGSKLIVALIWYVILGLGTLLYNVLLASILFDLDWSIIFSYLGQFEDQIFIKMIIRMVSISIIGGIISTIFALIFIYFSMALGKVSFRNKKIGGLWFIIFLVIFTITSILIRMIALRIPLFLNLETLRLSSIPNSFSSNEIHNFANGLVIGFNTANTVNITASILEIFASLIAFISTGYLIEKKIDL